MAGGLGIYQAFLDWLYRAGGISVPSEFHKRCEVVNIMIDNDISGVINTILDYSTNSATTAEFKIESNNITVEKLLNTWLDMININIEGVPSGLQELSREYYKERWQGSSLCLLRVKNWVNITVDNVTISVPTTLWFVNGSSIHIGREDNKNFKLGSDKYFLDSDKKIEIPKRLENIIVQKPFDRWFSEYSTPYLIRKGIYKNWKAIEVIQDKSNEVITKILPYLFVIQKGTEKLFTEGNIDYSDKELKPLVENMKAFLEKYKASNSSTPLNAVPFDQKYQHLIPDLTKILSEELYRQGYRAILSGLGFVDIIQGISSTRKESVLNPKPFLAEVNAGVTGFKSILLDAIRLIVEKNKQKHKKIFSDNNRIEIVSSPLRINIEEIIEYIRSGYDRGILSIKTYIESLGYNFNIEKDRRQKELEDGDEDTFYPHLIQNEENTPDRVTPVKPRNEKNENQNKKKESPEADNFKAEELDWIKTNKNSLEKIIEKSKLPKNIEAAPYTLKNAPKSIKKLSRELQELWVRVWNETFAKYKDEARAHRTAWFVVNKERTKNKRKNTKKKAHEDKKEELTNKKLKLVDKLLKEDG